MGCTDCTKTVSEVESCFDCPDFSAAYYAHKIINAVESGTFEADEDLMEDFKKFQNAKFVPTTKRQAITFMDKVAVRLVSILGTMAFFWFCMVLVTIPLIWPKTMPVLQYLSSGYLQLIFLPLIMVSGNLQQRRAELREESAYKITIKQDIQIEYLTYKLEQLRLLITTK